jgi:hypothetical protein
MGNGQRPKTKKDKKIEVSTRKSQPQPERHMDELIGGGGGSLGHNGPSSKPVCWEFTLLDLRPVAKQAEIGMEIYGLIQPPRVVIANSKLGPLGFAPSGAAEKMIQAASRRAGELQGNILSISKAGDTIRARLCLI